MSKELQFLPKFSGVLAQKHGSDRKEFEATEGYKKGTDILSLSLCMRRIPWTYGDRRRVAQLSQLDHAAGWVIAGFQTSQTFVP